MPGSIPTNTYSINCLILEIVIINQKETMKAQAEINFKNLQFLQNGGWTLVSKLKVSCSNP